MRRTTIGVLVLTAGLVAFAAWSIVLLAAVSDRFAGNVELSTQLDDLWVSLKLAALLMITTAGGVLALTGYALFVVAPRVRADTERLATLTKRIEASVIAGRGLGHELGGPMTTALTTLQVLRDGLRDGGETEDEHMSLLDEAIRALARASGTLQDLRAPSEANEEATIDVQAPRSVVAPMSRLRVLLIDDDDLVLASVARVLVAHDVTARADSTLAIDEAIAGDFDLIFCDVMMPGKTGIEVYRAVTSARPELAARFVFMSGGSVEREIEKFLDSAPARIDKPFGADELREVVARYGTRPPKPTA